MKKIILFLSLALMACTSTLNATQLDTVTDLDINKYAGDWHQIAIIPNKFQAICYSETKASYKLLPPNRKGVSHIEVTNTCFKEDGEFNAAVGTARVNPDYNVNSKLEVVFFSLLGFPVWFTAGNYWVLDIGDNYEYVVIGEPKRKLGWILARTRSLNKTKLSEIKALLADQGYNPCQFMMSRNSKLHLDQLPTLCEYTN